MTNVQFDRFDQVRLLTTKNVKYLSSRADVNVHPDGIWSVIAAVNQDLLLSKHMVVIRIPASDVSLISKYDLTGITNILGNLTNGKVQKRQTRSSRKEDNQDLQ